MTHGLSSACATATGPSVAGTGTAVHALRDAASLAHVTPARAAATGVHARVATASHATRERARTASALDNGGGDAFEVAGERRTLDGLVRQQCVRQVGDDLAV